MVPKMFKPLKFDYISYFPSLCGFIRSTSARLHSDRTEGHTFLRTYPHTENQKNYMAPALSDAGGIKMYRQELQFLWSAHGLMMLYISVKFHENILNGFQV